MTPELQCPQATSFKVNCNKKTTGKRKRKREKRGKKKKRAEAMMATNEIFFTHSDETANQGRRQWNR